MDSSIQEQVQRKIERINELLKKPGNNLPVVSLAVGVAFADRVNPGDSILDDAEVALASLREQGEDWLRVLLKQYRIIRSRRIMRYSL